MKTLSLSLMPEILAVCRLAADAPLPFEALQGEFWAVTRTADELSVIIPEGYVPAGWQAEKGWRCLKVLGPLEFDIVGVVSSISSVLAGADIPIFVISTYDTDYILINQNHIDRAVQALKEAGHSIK